MHAYAHSFGHMGQPSHVVTPDMWSDLSRAEEIAGAFAHDAQQGLDHCEAALKASNVAIRRNGLRVMERLLQEEAPLALDDARAFPIEWTRFDGRPLLMFEAEAALRRLRAKGGDDLDNPYGGLPQNPDEVDNLTRIVWEQGDEGSLRALLNLHRFLREAKKRHGWTRPVPPSGFAGGFDAAGWASALGQRTLAHARMPFSGRQDYGGRDFAKVAPMDRTPAEESYLWLRREEEQKKLEPFWGFDYELVWGPRRRVTESLGRQLPHTSTASHQEAFSALRFLEDPLLLPGVFELASSKSDAARRKAIVALGLLGDDRLLQTAARCLETQSRDLRACIWGLGYLGDSRGYEMLWRMVEERLSPSRALEVMGMFGELGAAGAHRLFAKPSLFKFEGARRSLFYLAAGNEIGALVGAMDSVKPDVAKQALRPFSMTAKRIRDLEWASSSFEEGGLVRDPNGVWIWNPVGPSLSAEEHAQAVRSTSWWEYVQAINEINAPDHLPLSPGSSINAWTGEIRRHLEATIRRGEGTVQERGRALDRLRKLAGPLAKAWEQRALAPLPEAEAGRIRTAASGR